MNKEEHTIEKESGGKNESGWIASKCSCGWRSKDHFAHNDYQHTNLREETQAHLRSVKNSQEKNW